MISYTPNEHDVGKYGLSYTELRDDYLRFTMMSDEDFLSNLLDILHFTCIVCWLKEKQAQHLLADNGLIHELVHLLVAEKRQALITDTPLARIREMFDRDCCLA